MTTKPEEIARAVTTPDKAWVPRVGEPAMVCKSFPSPRAGKVVLITRDNGGGYWRATFEGYTDLEYGTDDLQPVPADPTREEREPLQVIAWKDCEPAAKAPDPYEQHRNDLVDRLRQHNRWQPSTPLDVLTAASMSIEDAAPHLWAKAAGKDGRSNRDRLVAGLKAEQAWRERPDMLATFPKAARNPR